MQVLAKAFDPGLGGRNLDHLLVHYFSDEFKTKYKIDAFQHPKRLLRLMGEVEKVKKTMSTVGTPVPLTIECFADDKDVRGSIKRLFLCVLMLACLYSFLLFRELFVELCSEVINRITFTLETVLSKTSEYRGTSDKGHSK